MSELLTNVLKNLGCSYCQENEFHNESILEKYKGWKLYIKQYELYSAMILYNDKYEEDISTIINKKDSIELLDNDKIVLKLEFVKPADNETKYSILVPNDEYMSFYENIEDKDKPYDASLDAYYVGKYDIGC